METEDRFTPTRFVVKYLRSGSAYYSVDIEEWNMAQPSQEVNLRHLLSGDEFQGGKAHLAVVDTETIPNSYVLDAIALNPLISYTLGGKFHRMGKHSKAFLVEKLKEFLALPAGTHMRSILEEIVKSHE